MSHCYGYHKLFTDPWVIIKIGKGTMQHDKDLSELGR